MILSILKQAPLPAGIAVGLILVGTVANAQTVTVNGITHYFETKLEACSEMGVMELCPTPNAKAFPKKRPHNTGKKWTKWDVIAAARSASKKHGVPLKWMLAVAYQESTLNPYVTNWGASDGKDVGAWQINSYWHKRYRGGFNPYKGAEYAAWLLRHHRNRHGSWEKAVMAYHHATFTPGSKGYRYLYGYGNNPGVIGRMKNIQEYLPQS